MIRGKGKMILFFDSYLGEKDSRAQGERVVTGFGPDLTHTLRSALPTASNFLSQLVTSSVKG